MGTLNARLMSVYQSEMASYDTRALVIRKKSADFRFSCAPTRSPFTWRIWKMEKVNVSSYRLRVSANRWDCCRERCTVGGFTYKDQSHHRRPHGLWGVKWEEVDLLRRIRRRETPSALESYLHCGRVSSVRCEKYGGRFGPKLRKKRIHDGEDGWRHL
jgi:hypothetical protein